MTTYAYAPSNLSVDQPWQFRPENYAAKGDGKVILDATIAGGSLSVLTSATAVFTANDVGKHVVIDQAAGTTSAPLSTTIAGFTNSTTVTLTAAASNAVTNAYAMYGTDDTTAVRNCLAAMVTYAQANDWYAEMLFKPLVYVIAGPLVQGGGTLGNAQIPLPVNSAAGAKPTLTLAFTGVRGAQGPSMFTGSGQTPGPDWSGTVLFSTLTGQAYSATFGGPSMIGGPTPEQGYNGGFTDQWNMVMPVVQGITAMCPVIPTVNMLDFRSCSKMHVEWARAMVFTSFTSIASYNTPPSQGAVGLITPQGGNNAYSYIGSFTATGMGIGVEMAESVWAGYIGTFLCDTGIFFEPHNCGHGATIGRWAAESNNTHLFCDNVGTGPLPFNVESMECENVSQWNAGHFFDDQGNILGGLIHVNYNTTTGPSIITVLGASNLEVIFTGKAVTRGLQGSPPAVPATTTALVNPFWRHATVNVQPNGATIASIKVDGTVLTGITSGMVRVPSGRSITLTYTVATPAWQWVLD